MLTRLAGASLRAILIAALIAVPSLLLPQTSADTAMVAVILAVVAALFTLVEYTTSAPSLVEFRSAPPFNRVRFGSLLLTVFALSLIVRGVTDPSTLTRLVGHIGHEIALALDFPYSPVRLVVLILPETMSPELLEAVRTAAATSYLISILALGIFLLRIRLGRWPGRHGTFNVWVNLPTFDPTVGGDVVERLRQASQINQILGFLLPFLIPAVLEVAATHVDPIDLSNPHTLVWTLTAWAFLPASMLMRGIALNRVADLICVARRRVHATAEGGLAPA